MTSKKVEAISDKEAVVCARMIGIWMDAVPGRNVRIVEDIASDGRTEHRLVLIPAAEEVER